MDDFLAEPALLTPAGERILTAAAQLFYAHGIRATGMDAVAEAAETTKKTIYDRFGSKDALVAFYLIRRARRWQHFLDAALDRQPPGPHRIIAVFDALEQWSDGTGRGCAFVNAYAEIGIGIGIDDHPGIAVIRAEKAWMRSRFTALVAEAGIQDAERVASVVQLLYEGAQVIYDVGNVPDALAAARDATRQLLAAEKPAS